MPKIVTQIIDEFTTKINSLTEKLYDYLIAGRLFDFEQELWSEVQHLYNNLALAFLSAVVESTEVRRIARL